jgi:hypothetical protein
MCLSFKNCVFTCNCRKKNKTKKIIFKNFFLFGFIWNDVSALTLSRMSHVYLASEDPSKMNRLEEKMKK